MQNHQRMKQQNHYNQALAYLRDFCLRHGRLMHYDRGAVLEAEGTAARLFGYIESGSIHYLVRNYEGGESTVESVAAGDLVGNYPYCLDGDAAPHVPRRRRAQRGLCRRWRRPRTALPPESGGGAHGPRLLSLSLRASQVTHLQSLLREEYPRRMIF